MTQDGVHVHGSSGPPVLLLPGGAEACEGFFPGLVEGLADCQVIVHDRPGTGSATAGGSLADAAAHLNALIDRLGFGPVVVVGQSLGGAVAVLLARDHPENVAGLVLLDPTPINDPRTCATLERVARATGKIASIPGPRHLIAAAMPALTARTARGLRPDCAEALRRNGRLDFTVLARAVDGITELSKGLREADLPRRPCAVVTADRKPTAPIRRAHARLATAFGAPLLCWPGATHNVHLDHPDETLATVREVVAQVRS
ncbi:alpha/beta fold hydrolase [Amycolatopsis magusensis]|uniref:Pimeloyl-ACP methyl ester carboxylesterase n=1 Tax=Amycolatopsis magusensis TaxID=882444 RepID=A0ABS4PSA9_9PSEU|nr:alpha/beta hydrolase [Amycolatopsis magusensis]MBP2181749.1 pimeloyl-ACP methyl ester carboxylesterase [Amycolatopsis magusensis]